MDHPTVMIVMEDLRTVDSTTILQFHPVTSHLVIIVTETVLVRLLESIVTILRFLPLVLLANMTIIGGTLGGPPFLPLHLDMIERLTMQTTIIPLAMHPTHHALILVLVCLLCLVTPTTEDSTRDCLLLVTVILILL